jgi:hypothetical protein
MTDSYRQAIRITLARSAGEATDATLVAAATLSIWELMAAKLEPVIGTTGVDVLFIRALHLTSSVFPWLAIAETQRESAVLHVKKQLAEHETDAASEAAYTLLVTVTELLSTLIGVSLTERLLARVWVPSSRVSKKETVA